ncbi:MAG TPA: CPBP family intramembrane glutamic endopeptidase [Patescibacteria group bacterium]|nr:CPBP family intramembrane glutamic endopeptidase [Patescibacteria group bacterium]
MVAGVTSIVALAGWWKLIAQLEHISGSLLPDVSKYPALTVALVVAMGSIVSPFFEQAGFWGYCQTRLEREFSAPTAILITALLFGLLPHPPMHVMLWPKLILFFLAGLTFSLMAYLTRSILPGLAVHVFSLLAFFTVVFRADSGRVRSTALLWIHGSQMVVFAILSIAAFVRVRRLTEPARRSGPDAQGSAESLAG